MGRGCRYKKRDSGGPLALLDKLRHELELDMTSAARDEQEAQRSYENFMSDSVSLGSCWATFRVLDLR